MAAAHPFEESCNPLHRLCNRNHESGPATPDPCPPWWTRTTPAPTSLAATHFADLHGSLRERASQHGEVGDGQVQCRRRVPDGPPREHANVSSLYVHDRLTLQTDNAHSDRSTVQVNLDGVGAGVRRRRGRGRLDNLSEAAHEGLDLFFVYHTGGDSVHLAGVPGRHGEREANSEQLLARPPEPMGPERFDTDLTWARCPNTHGARPGWELHRRNLQRGDRHRLLYARRTGVEHELLEPRQRLVRALRSVGQSGAARRDEAPRHREHHQRPLGGRENSRPSHHVPPVTGSDARTWPARRASMLPLSAALDARPIIGWVTRDDAARRQ